MLLGVTRGALPILRSSGSDSRPSGLRPMQGVTVEGTRRRVNSVYIDRRRITSTLRRHWEFPTTRIGFSWYVHPLDKDLLNK